MNYALTLAFVSLAFSAYAFVLGLDMISEYVRNPIAYKRNGALHFIRIGRVSASFCIRKAN